MKYLMTALFLLATQAAAAAPQIEFPSMESASECATQAGQLMVRYTELFDLGPEVKTIRFESFRNTTPGSFNQEYQANIALIHSREIEFGVNKTRLDVTFSSPFICDDLKILKIKNRGVDKKDPLYACLHDKAKTGSLQNAEDLAFKTHLDAMSKACESVPYGAEKQACFDAWHQTVEGKALFDTLKAAQKAVSEYNEACYAAYPNP